MEQDDDGLGPLVRRDCVQKLFERELGSSPKQLPAVQYASDRSSEADQLRFKVGRGRALDYQAVPAPGVLLGHTHHPARPAPHSARRAGQPPAAPQPAHATLWALLQPAPSVCVTTALSAVDAGAAPRSGFAGWSQDGFADVTRRASLEYSLAGHPGGSLSAEVDLLSTVPKLPLLPQLTVRHRLATGKAEQGVRHSSTLSAPLLRGAALARLQVAEAAAGGGPGGSIVTLEVEGRGRRSRGLAGNVKLAPALAGAFHGTDASGSGGSGGGGSGSDSDDDGSGGGDAHRRRQHVPGLRVQARPAGARGWEDVSGRWQQSWGGRAKSTLGYQAQQRRWSLELGHKLSGALTATGSLAWDGPAGGADAGAAGGEAAPRRLLPLLRACADGSRLRRAALRLACRLPRPAPPPGAKPQRRLLQLETTYDAEAGAATHGLKLRLGGRGAADWQQQSSRCDLGLQARPHQRALDLTFDFFAPL